ncbi:MAG: thiamine-phosphate kinase [Actinomycetota bacterium]|nr:thiamine-phosphate kinase [Actinomycetota bacterium]
MLRQPPRGEAVRSRRAEDGFEPLTTSTHLSEIGEFGLIDRLRTLVGEPAEGEVWIGDDAAVLRAPAGTILFTTDLLIEKVHFDLTLTGPEDLGYKAIAVNASDVAAMGGVPRRAVVGLGLRRGLELEWVESLYAGMRSCCEELDMAVVGGDLSRSEVLVISVSLIGNPAGRLVVPRSGARVGDIVCVTGTLGAGAAGLALLRMGNESRPDLVEAHLRPKARVREAEVLRRHLPTAMIDISDGFAVDLGHICEDSGVGVVVNAGALPLADLSGLELSRSALQLALSGGEDYELCFTIPEQRCEAAISAVIEATGTPVTKVGEVVDAKRGRVLLLDTDERPLEAPGWDHLRV